MDKNFPKTYDPKKVEDRIYKTWEKSGYFNPDNLDLPENAKSYTIILPPPNITDKLHLGHSVMLAVQDLLIRFHRMNGYRTLWVPGTDHAAIATQNVVEKKLLKEEGITRHDLGKEKFLEKVWEYALEKQSAILYQTKKMGSSLDWSRTSFTLDDERKKAVSKMFVDMYNDGVVYRGERIVNWCPRCHTTLADDEVEYEAQKAKIYTFKYSKDFPFTIATTRLETKLGDTAVAVNPKDNRYKKYIGKTYKVDFIGIPLNLKIIADRNIDMDFGTGAVGVTPAHSMVDWKMAEENGLEIKKVIGENGNIKEGFGQYSGKSTLEARKVIIKKLKSQKLLEKEEEVDNNLSVCYRCNTPIEPLPSKQWFISVDKKLQRLGNRSLKEKAIEAAEKEAIKFVPERFNKKYLDWMKNLHDWCISRQIWYGHQIPVWYRLKHKNIKIHKNKRALGSLRAEGKLIETYCGVENPDKVGKGLLQKDSDTIDSKSWTQDPDTLDTWFSSGMWTFSTLGWPDNFKNGKKLGDLDKFHPTQVLETGYEILTLWVSRMIMMSFFAIGEIPFENVYLHGMVLDKYGKKMSKSKGNGIDPLDVIEKYGTDAVRLSLLIGNTPGNDMKLYDEKIAKYRNFTNKIWNVSRFIIQKVDSKEISKEIKSDLLSDRWILEKMRGLIIGVSEDIEKFRFSQAGEKLHDFTWNDFADWYLEASKFERNEKTKNSILMMILKDLLKLWHPFMPYITEHIWSEIKSDKLLLIEKWPNEENYSTIIGLGDTNLMRFELIQEIVTAIRNARAENKIDPRKKMKVIIDTKNFKEHYGINASEINEFLNQTENLITSLRTGISELEIKSDGEKVKKSIHRTVSGINIYIPIEGLVDIGKESKKAEKELENLEKYISRLESKLKNKNFTEKAPEKIVNSEKENLKKSKSKFNQLKEHIKELT